MGAMWRACVSGVLLTATAACASLGPPPYEPGLETDAEVYVRLQRTVLDRYYGAHPIEATRLGIHAQDHLLPAVDQLSRSSRSAEITEQLTALNSIDPAGLDADSARDRTVLIHALAGERHELDSVRGLRHNPRLYPLLIASGAATLIDREFAPLPTRLDALVARLNAVPATLAAARKNLADVPLIFAEMAVGDADSTATFLEGDALEALAAQGYAEVDEARRTRVDAAIQLSVTELRRFAKWLQDDLQPRANGDYRLGRERFEAKLRYEEHIHATADELRTMNEQAIERYHAWVEREAARIDPSRPVADIVAEIAGQFPSAGLLLEEAQTAVHVVRDFVIAKKLMTLPSDDLPIIRESPRYQRRGYASMSTPGPFETVANESFYNITNVDPSWTPDQYHQHLSYFNAGALIGISIHEAVPGHFTQLIYATKLASEVRRVFQTAAFVEGWAHYAEQMMLDEGLGGGDPALRIAQLRRALQRHARWYAALAIHVYGESIDQVAERYAEIAFFAPFIAERETRRATYDPTYLYYAWGRMKILELREACKRHKGAGFTLQAFHDRLLTLGLPLTLAESTLLDDPVCRPALSRADPY